MLESLQRGSSPVDWCEGNYLFSPVVAEFVNTISNVLFVLMPPVLIHLFQQYSRFISQGINIIWVLLIIVGISSAYFHATLSLLGQLLDELAILWVMMAGFGLWYPRRLLPIWLKGRRGTFQLLVTLVAMVSTMLACIHPAVNAFALMCGSLPAAALLITEVKTSRCPRVTRLGYRCSVVWILAVFCWVNDKLFCDFWVALRFPYLHGFWHVLIFIASYSACVLFAYFEARNEAPEQTPVLRFWPDDSFELGIPYVKLKTAHKHKEDLNKI